MLEFEAAKFLFKVLHTAAGHAGRSLHRKMRRKFKSHWLEVPAVIDVVSVVTIPDAIDTAYVGTLTYFFRNPELHTGDYEAEFGSMEWAQRWVEQYKGRRVMVRVNPKNFDDSVLLELPATHQNRPHLTVQPVARAQPSAPRRKPIQAEVLTESQRTLAEYGQLVSIAGLGAGVTVLGLTLAGGVRMHSSAIGWLGAALLALLLASAGELSFRVTRKPTLPILARFYADWCPAFARTVLAISAFVLLAVLLLALDQFAIPAPARATIGAYLTYFVVAWVFLASWAMHTAILRSQRGAEGLNERPARNARSAPRA